MPPWVTWSIFFNVYPHYTCTSRVPLGSFWLFFLAIFVFKIELRFRSLLDLEWLAPSHETIIRRLLLDPHTIVASVKYVQSKPLSLPPVDGNFLISLRTSLISWNLQGCYPFWQGKRCNPLHKFQIQISSRCQQFLFGMRWNLRRMHLTWTARPDLFIDLK